MGSRLRSYNQLVWKISPKNLPGGTLPVEIAAYTSAHIFNESNIALLKIMEAIGIACGPNAHAYIAQEGETRINIADQESTRKSRMFHRQIKKIKKII